MYSLTTNTSLTFVMEGAEQVLAFRAKVSVEKVNIISVNWYEKFNNWPDLQIRMPGSYLPSWIMSGSYWNEEGWDFVLAKKPKGFMRPVLFNVLMVETGQSRYKRIIIGMDKQKAKEIIDWWKH